MWEASMTAGHHGLDRLTLIVDRNRLQQGDRTEETNRLDPLGDRFRAFGWGVREMNGHDHGALRAALDGEPFAAGKPNCLIANTNKGTGVAFMTDNVAWHHRVPNADEYQRALVELAAVSS